MNVHPRPMALLIAGALLSAACGGSEPEEAVPFEIQISPQIVQGAVPASPTGVLATISDGSPTDQPVVLTATADGATVTVDPAEIRDGEVAEITIVAGAVEAETPMEITLTGRRGDLEATASVMTRIMPWEDGVGEYAGDLLALFTAWLAENRPELGIGPETPFEGSFVCPLLVVTHYLFLTEEWEIGLSWHVMIPPDDWSEIYLRTRDELAPTLAFRLASQAAALQDGVVTIEEVEPPPEVVR